MLSFALAFKTPSNFHFVSKDDDMWANNIFEFFAKSLDGVERMGSPSGVNPCVQPNFILFVSFNVLSIVLNVEDFDASGHFNPILLELEEIPPLPHFESVLPMLHPKFVLLLSHFKSIVVGKNVDDFNDVVYIDFIGDVLLKSRFMGINEKEL